MDIAGLVTGQVWGWGDGSGDPGPGQELQESFRGGRARAIQVALGSPVAWGRDQSPAARARSWPHSPTPCCCQSLWFEVKTPSVGPLLCGPRWGAPAPASAPRQESGGYAVYRNHERSRGWCEPAHGNALSGVWECGSAGTLSGRGPAAWSDLFLRTSSYGHSRAPPSPAAATGVVPLNPAVQFPCVHGDGRCKAHSPRRRLRGPSSSPVAGAGVTLGSHGGSQDHEQGKPVPLGSHGEGDATGREQTQGREQPRVREEPRGRGCHGEGSSHREGNSHGEGSSPREGNSRREGSSHREGSSWESGQPSPPSLEAPCAQPPADQHPEGLGPGMGHITTVINSISPRHVLALFQGGPGCPGLL